MRWAASRADKEYVFRASPEALTGVRKAGLDVLTLANNRYGLDYGPDALLETIRQVEQQQMLVAGAGQDAAEDAPVIVPVRGMRIGYLKASAG